VKTGGDFYLYNIFPMPISLPDATGVTDDSRIESVSILPPPENLIRFFPITGTPTESMIQESRRTVSGIIQGTSDKLIVISGPCSIHDPKTAKEYAELLAAERKKYKDTLEIIMRVYFEKPRTTVWWKWLINDPYLDGTFKIDEWLRIARQLLIEINQWGVPAATEFLDMISPQYIWDLISWWAIGARTTESQTHRELASGISAPVGFKNGTDGNLKIAIDAIIAAAQAHHFLSIHKNGNVAIVQTRWNLDCHLILRWWKQPNYDRDSIHQAMNALSQAEINWSRVMVDLSHGNSEKVANRQIEVAHDIAWQIREWNDQISWIMIESHLEEWWQKFTPGKDDPSKLSWRKSITDECIGWEKTLEIFREMDDAVRIRRSNRIS
jgi:3-deoxy-7-phosphoheptulonate synthase